MHNVKAILIYKIYLYLFRRDRLSSLPEAAPTTRCANDDRTQVEIAELSDSFA
ncbi:hypothetical protein NIES4072_03260 [Nostoc commune NIES-4072]|uniref:Uncharacterized protein n=1 Tax=Nostoc commune NIES-4072 TaxID=2005467 RepID=A0A2R5FE63_NOSCO|nr:hypothetical protein NIES4070_23560 [Nostoc commune HK-02]GBG16680.1 hypothetical protein NIES4072_03260 [Nostoc commune NIES-4072]